MDAVNLPPLPIGSVPTDSTSVPLPSGLPTLPSLPGLGTVSSAAGSTVNPAEPGSTTPTSTSNDGVLTRGAYLVLGLVFIAGAIFVYRLK